MKLWVKDILREMALMLAIALIVTLVILAFHSAAKAQSSVVVLSKQTSTTSGITGNLVTPKCVLGSTSQNNAISLDVSFQRGIATKIYTSCTQGIGAGSHKILVAVSTDLTGEILMKQAKWRYDVSGNDDWVLTVKNVTMPNWYCCFTADAANASDIITVRYRMVTP